MKELTLEFMKIVGEGKALGRAKGKVVFAYGALPGETARIKITKEKRNFIEGEVIEIISPSLERIQPKEDHYLNCSPWQIMNYDFQAKTKKNLIEELLYQTTKENIQLENFYKAENLFGYRTKIEYSFTEIDGKLAFAFHKRGAYYEKIHLPTGCALFGEKPNKAALEILDALNKNGIKKEQLKTLVIRRAQNTEDIVACLYSKDENISLEFSDIKNLSGFLLIYSNPVASINTVDKILSVKGYDFITEKIGDMSFSYGFDCFFQNNITLFEKALDEIKPHINKGSKLMDLYCGVGVIGFYMKDLFSQLTSLEISQESLKYAQKNIVDNKLKNINLLCLNDKNFAEEYFKNQDIILLDPPRAGLHKNVVKHIMASAPQKIIYLSCNPITQGRDALFFLEKYSVKKAVGFDFYPNTPHAENLLVFEKK